jgi:hypothetical protein
MDTITIRSQQPHSSRAGLGMQNDRRNMNMMNDRRMMDRQMVSDALITLNNLKISGGKKIRKHIQH